MSARRRIFTGLLASIYGRAVLVIGQIILVPVLISRWGVGGYGEWIAVSALTSYLSYTNVGMPGALRAHMAMAFARNGERAMQEAFQSSVILVAALAAAGAGAFIAVIHLVRFDQAMNLHWMGHQQAETVATVLAAQLAIYAVASVLNAAVSSIGRYPQANLLDALRQTLELGGLVLAVGVGRANPAAAVWVYVGSWSLYGLALAADLGRHAPWLYHPPVLFRTSVLKDLARPMLGVLGMTFGYVGMSVQAPRIILSMVVGPQATAVYALASMMMRIVRIPIDIPAHSATVEISIVAGRGDMDTARRLMTNIIRICLWLALISIPVVILAGPWISFEWTRHRTQAPVGILALMSVSTIFFGAALPCQEGLMAVGQLHKATRWLLIGSIPFLVICWLLARVWSINGVALAVSGLDLVYAGSGIAAVLRHFGYRAPNFWRPLLRPPLELLVAEARRLRNPSKSEAVTRN
jgi:O-antigen/teichoic acid export membrane protein